MTWNGSKALPAALMAGIGVTLCAAVLVWIWPGAALADDCLRAPYNAEDCLRTSGWAPTLAGVTAALTGFFASLGEIKNTLVSFAERGLDKAQQAASEAADALGDLGEQLSEDAAEVRGDLGDMVDWYNEQVESNNAPFAQASGTDNGEMPDEWTIRKLFPNAPFFQDSMDKIHEATGDTKGAEENRRRVEFAENVTPGVRWTFAGLTAALWAAGALIASAPLWPAIPIGLIGYYLPDAAAWVQGFMLSRKKK